MPLTLMNCPRTRNCNCTWKSSHQGETVSDSTKSMVFSCGFRDGQAANLSEKDVSAFSQPIKTGWCVSRSCSSSITSVASSADTEVQQVQHLFHHGLATSQARNISWHFLFWASEFLRTRWLLGTETILVNPEQSAFDLVSTWLMQHVRFMFEAEEE